MTLWAFYSGEGLDVRWLWRLIVGDPARCGWLLLASALLYATGMIANDLADVERDRILAPRRPLPAGRIGLPAAAIACGLCGIGAVVAALLGAGPLGGLAALVVLALALLYDFETKHWPWLGAVTMGLTRAAHALFALLIIGNDALRGAFFAAADSPARAVLWYPFLLFLYVTGLTVIGGLAHRPGQRWELLLGGALMTSALLGASACVLTSPWQQAWLLAGGAWPMLAVLCDMAALGVLGGLLWSVGRPWWRALRAASRAQAQQALIAGLGGLILFDALAASAAHPIAFVILLPLYALFLAAAAVARMD